MASRKRGRDEMESSEPPKGPSLLDKIRDTWELASLMQYIFLFGKVVKIDEDFDVEDFETECLKPGSSDKLEEIGLTLLKWISSHRGLTLEIWDEYTRRQYLAKAPHLNPYGVDEQPRKFRDFDVFQKIRVLHQLSIWTFWNPDRMREKMPQERELDQTEWRIEEIGYDRHERLYYVLDDNRLYRRTDPPIPAQRAKPKAKSLKAQAARRRVSKRRRVEDSETPEVMEEESVLEVEGAEKGADPENQGAHPSQGFKWECLAITLGQYQEFIETIRKSKEPNEKILREQLLDHIMPNIEKAEEAQRRKLERKERELQNMEKLLGAKRSSRLADKHDRQRQEQEAADTARKHAAELAAAHREQERLEKMEQDRQSRMMTREQRIKEREYKRLLHEEELAKIAEEAKKVEAGEARGSERHLKAQIEKRKKDLEELEAEEDWIFDCSGCGVHGQNLDDGSHIVACEKCNVWQHSKCLGISKTEAEKDDFHFLCADCQQRIEDAKKPKISLKFRAGLSSSPPQPHKSEDKLAGSPLKQQFQGVEIPVKKRGPGRPPGSKSATTANSIAHSVPRGPGRPQGQRRATNGFNGPQSSSQSNSGSSPLFQSITVAQNGSMTSSTNFSQYANSHPQPRPNSTSPSTGPPRTSYSSPQPPKNGYGLGLSSAGDLSVSQTPLQHPPSANDNFSFARPSSAHGQQIQSYSHTSLQHQHPSHPSSKQPSNAHQNDYSNTVTTPAARLPSPIQNRPTMSPTQGNHDVGLLAGIPQKSNTIGSESFPRTSTYHNAPNTHVEQVQNGISLPNHAEMSTPASISRSPNLNHLSGLSPTKNSPVLPPPGPLPRSSASPTGRQGIVKGVGVGAGRSVSGTPIFPPAERLAPSPEQLRKSPVPTPSKSAAPTSNGEQEQRRVSAMDVQQTMMNGDGYDKESGAKGSA